MLPCLDKCIRLLSVSATVSLSGALAGCGGGGGGGAGTLVARAPAPAASASASVSSTSPPVVYKQPSNTFYEYTGSFASDGLGSRMQIEGSHDADGDFNATSMDVTLGEDRRRFLVTSVVDNKSTSQENRHSVYVLSSGGGLASMTGVIGSNTAELYRARASSEDDDYLSVSNLLTSSLGATTLSYAYVGLGHQVSATQMGGFDVYTFNFFGGQKTQTADMPDSGTASYTGGFVGELTHFDSSGARSDTLDGNVSLAANFGTKTIQGSVEGIRLDRTSPSTFTIDVNGTISGNQFSGTSALSHINAGTSVGTQSGQMQGGFFGPKAAEAAGALAVKSTDSDATMLVTGSFGAKKQQAR